MPECAPGYRRIVQSPSSTGCSRQHHASEKAANGCHGFSSCCAKEGAGGARPAVHGTTVGPKLLVMRACGRIICSMRSHQNQHYCHLPAGERQLVGELSQQQNAPTVRRRRRHRRHGIERTAGIDDPLVVGRLRRKKPVAAAAPSMQPPYAASVVPECGVEQHALPWASKSFAMRPVLDLFLFQGSRRVQQTGAALLQLGQPSISGFVRRGNLFGSDRGSSVCDNHLPESIRNRKRRMWRKQRLA